MRGKQAQLIAALTGAFKPHHGLLVKTHYTLIDSYDQAISEITQHIEVVIEPFRVFRELLTSIPGISTTVADIVIAETGADMTRFPTAAHLASWAGVAPGSNESAGKHKTASVRHGNKHLKAALGIAALSVTRTKNTYLAARFQRVKARRGGKRALVALQHTMITTIWHMATNGTYYQDPGTDYHDRQNPNRTRQRLIKALNTLGYDVTLTLKEAA
ncbi:transposase [Tessaracoccus caeni]|uniref:transposase n=1 Tax=Tessaracoccus caeni TaxID=3031239 RepID=UPI0023D9CA3E|nr:transposase [Tessaracoccus caeni]MDF1488545.1 transposase [Tessaracoccus caeni]